MLGRKEEARSKKPHIEEAAAACTATITTTSGEVLTMSEFISRIDAAAKRRIGNMNQKLRDLELQMEALEANMRAANGSSMPT